MSSEPIVLTKQYEHEYIETTLQKKYVRMLGQKCGATGKKHKNCYMYKVTTVCDKQFKYNYWLSEEQAMLYLLKFNEGK